MYVLTNNKDVVVNIANSVTTQSNGNYLVDNGETTIVVEGIIKNVYEVSLEAIEKVGDSKSLINRYCYTNENGFYQNPDFKEFYPIEERLAILEDMVNMILLG